MKSFQRFEHDMTGWGSSMHMYGTVLCVPSHSTQTRTYALLTGSGFSSLSSVFISDGCTPLRLTPYATHRRLCTINQTSQTHTHSKLYSHAYTRACKCAHQPLPSQTPSEKACFSDQSSVRQKNKQKNVKMDDWVTRCVRIMNGERRPYC